MQTDDETSEQKSQKNFMRIRWFIKELNVCGLLPNNYVCTDRIWPNNFSRPNSTVWPCPTYWPLNSLSLLFMEAHNSMLTLAQLQTPHFTLQHRQTNFYHSLGLMRWEPAVLLYTHESPVGLCRKTNHGPWHGPTLNNYLKVNKPNNLLTWI